MTSKPATRALKWLLLETALEAMKSYNRDLNLILAGLFELRLVCLENEETWDAIGTLAEKLGGDRSAMYFGAPPPERLSSGADR